MWKASCVKMERWRLVVSVSKAQAAVGLEACNHSKTSAHRWDLMS